MKCYIDLLSDILENGEVRKDRTGTGTISIFGSQMKFDLRKGFPILTTRKMYWKGALVELLWILKGDTNTKYLEDNNVNWWKPWEDENGDLGYVYGKILRDFDGKDQLLDFVDGIKNDPFSRRHIMQMWHPARMHEARLPSCHGCFIQAYVHDGGYLSLHMVQRSADMFLGVPTNIIMYAFLLHMLAQVCNLKPHTLTHTISDSHIYLNHVDQVKELIKRDPYELPTLTILNKTDDILNFNIEDFQIDNYIYHPKLSGVISV